MTHSLDKKFLADLRRMAGARKRLTLEQVWACFQRQRMAEHHDRDALSEALQRLATTEALKLPSGARHWDDTVAPPLPAFVTLLKPAKRTDRASVSLEAIPWAPELSFAASVTRRDHVEVLTTVQRFLAEGGRARPMVPERERSVELFGDEKRLEHLRRGALFGEDKLSLELLRCFSVSPPLVWDIDPEGRRRAALVIENHHTYHSFVRWNRQTHTYRAVVYGSGRAFVKSCESLRDLVERHDVQQIRYFGDLDPQGLQIPMQASDALRTRGLPPCEAAEFWYEELLTVGRNRTFEQRKSQGEWEAYLAWLPTRLHSETTELLRRGHRLPQELVGWETLMTVGCD